MKEIRIAVCLFGQVRTGLYCAEYIKRLYNLSNVTINGCIHPVKIDFFCSVKNYNTNGHVSGKVFGEESTVLVPQSDIDELLNTYNPILSNVIDYKLDLKYYKRWVYLPMITGLIDSINLKSRYELDHQFVYDYCFCQRYDCLVHPIDIIKRIILQIEPGLAIVQYYNINNNEDSHVSMGDFWWGSDSLSIDLMAASLGRIQYINEKNKEHNFWYIGLGPNVCLYKALSENDIMIKTPNFGIDVVLVRPEADLSIPVIESFLLHREFYTSNHPGLPKK